MGVHKMYATKGIIQFTQTNYKDSNWTQKESDIEVVTNTKNTNNTAAFFITSFLSVYEYIIVNVKINLTFTIIILLILPCTSVPCGHSVHIG